MLEKIKEKYPFFKFYMNTIDPICINNEVYEYIRDVVINLPSIVSFGEHKYTIRFFIIDEKTKLYYPYYFDEVSLNIIYEIGKIIEEKGYLEVIDFNEYRKVVN